MDKKIKEIEIKYIAIIINKEKEIQQLKEQNENLQQKYSTLEELYKFEKERINKIIPLFNKQRKLHKHCIEFVNSIERDTHDTTPHIA